MGVPSDVYLENQPSISEDLWHESTVLSDDDGYVVLGWVCGEPGGLRYVYVVPEFRRMGVANCLISHRCGDGKVQMALPWPHGRKRNGVYNPYIL